MKSPRLQPRTQSHQPAYAQVLSIWQVLPPLQCASIVHSTHMFMAGFAFTKQAAVGFMQPT